MKDESRIVKDPICGKDVDTLRARAVGIFGGVTYYFCSAECKAQYKDPRKTPRRDPTKDTPLPPHAPPPPDSGKVLAPPLKLVDVRSAPAPEAPPKRTPEPSTKRTAEPAPKRAPAAMALVPPPSESPVPASAPASAAGQEDVPLKPSRSRAPLVSLLIVMLIIAGGVVFYTLKYR